MHQRGVAAVDDITFIIIVGVAILLLRGVRRQFAQQRKCGPIRHALNSERTATHRIQSELTLKGCFFTKEWRTQLTFLTCSGVEHRGHAAQLWVQIIAVATVMFDHQPLDFLFLVGRQIVIGFGLVGKGGADTAYRRHTWGLLDTARFGLFAPDERVRYARFRTLGSPHRRARRFLRQTQPTAMQGRRQHPRVRVMRPSSPSRPF